MIAMLNLIVLVAAIALGACGDNTRPDDPPDSGVDVDASPACARCNGPGCEELEAACFDVDTESYAIVCDEGAVFEADQFTTRDAHGRIVHCRHPEE